MDPHLVNYILTHHDQFMTKNELQARQRLLATMKATYTGVDWAVQEEVARNSDVAWVREMFSNDPEVISLTQDGIQSFYFRTAERIWAAHSNEIDVNRCPRCHGVARTPKARQCRFCFHDWHNPT